MGRNGFERRLVRLEPGCDCPYEASEWVDELVVVVCGTLELEGLSGRCWHFRKGSILWLEEMPVRTLRACEQVAILMAVSRPISSRPPQRHR